CGPTTEKKSRPAGPAQPEATPRRANDQHTQPTQNHGAEPTEHPVPDVWHQTPATPPGKQGNKTRPTPTPWPLTRSTQPKIAGPPKCKLRTSIGKCMPHRQSSRDPPGQLGSQADPAMHHPALYRAQGKDTSLTSPEVQNN
ncbi:hypothetical protein CHARACLAT_029129, partial [Characodon lateralis]|nr:hypothetical protein [Characodon lateralis]